MSRPEFASQTPDSSSLSPEFFSPTAHSCCVDPWLGRLLALALPVVLGCCRFGQSPAQRLSRMLLLLVQISLDGGSDFLEIGSDVGQKTLPPRRRAPEL